MPLLLPSNAEVPSAARRAAPRWLRAACWVTTAVALACGAALIALYAREAGAPRLVCLMYHRFVTQEQFERLPPRERIYSIPVGRFEEQLLALRRAGYRGVTARDALAFARGECDLPPQCVLITIDDGCRSIADRAAPLLDRHGFPAVLFITTDAAAPVFGAPDAYAAKGGGAPRGSDRDFHEQSRLSPREMRRLAECGFEIESHAVTHRPLTDLDDDELDRELRDSRRTLAEWSGRPVTMLAAPTGRHDARVRAAARRAGYEALFTSDPGGVRPSVDLFSLPRLNASASDDAERLLARMSPASLALRRFGRLLRGAPQALLGERAGAPLRSAIAAVLPTDARLLNLQLCLAAAAALLWIARMRWNGAVRAAAPAAAVTRSAPHPEAMR